MKIGIFETEHFEGAYPVIKLFDIPSNQLVIFTTPATYRRFADLFKENVNRFEWVVVDPTSRLKFFRAIHRAARAHRPDIFYINTISNNHLLYARMIRRLPVTRVVLTIHDINCMFNSQWSWQPRRLLHHIGKKALTRQVQEYNVVSDTMIDYLKQQTNNRRLVHNVPGAVFENDQAQLAISDHIHLVVPGSIDGKRRDYNQVFELLELAEEQKLPLHITLLGGHTGAYGSHIMHKAKLFSGTHARLHFYDTDIVHQEEFDRQLNNAHFIFIPSVVQTAICFDIPETYGLTKSSGNIFDVIKHARPFIAPQTLRISPALESSCYKYTTLPEVVKFLASVKGQYDRWQQQALANSQEYTTAKVRERNARLFAN